MKEREIRRTLRIFPREGKDVCDLDECILDKDGHIINTKTIFREIPRFVAQWAAQRERNQDRDSVVIDFSNPSGVTVKSDNYQLREETVAGLTRAGVEKIVPVD